MPSRCNRGTYLPHLTLTSLTLNAKSRHIIWGPKRKLGCVLPESSEVCLTSVCFVCFSEKMWRGSLCCLSVHQLPAISPPRSSWTWSLDKIRIILHQKIPPHKVSLCILLPYGSPLEKGPTDGSQSEMGLIDSNQSEAGLIWQSIRGESHMAANQRCIWQMAANLKQCPLARQALSYLFFSGYYTDLILLLFRPNQLSSLRLSPVPHFLWTSLFQGELTTIGAYVQNKNGEFQLATLP